MCVFGAAKAQREKKVTSMARFMWFSALLIFNSASALASLPFVTDFSATNPLTCAYPNSTWSTPVNQFELFTAGSVSGQEVVPIGSGNPTVSGGAGDLGLNLDLSGVTGLQLTALLLPANQANVIQVLLLDGDAQSLISLAGHLGVGLEGAPIIRFHKVFGRTRPGKQGRYANAQN
jgi:hypothetical protein